MQKRSGFIYIIFVFYFKYSYCTLSDEAKNSQKRIQCIYFNESEYFEIY